VAIQPFAVALHPNVTTPENLSMSSQSCECGENQNIPCEIGQNVLAITMALE
jgi:hypothetical protein